MSEIYLKTESWIAALSMLMVLCPLICSVSEWWFRKILKEHKATVMNPRKKPTSNPSIKRVFFLFRKVRQVLVHVDENVCCHILNVNAEIMQILRMFGNEFEIFMSDDSSAKCRFPTQEFTKKENAQDL